MNATQQNPSTNIENIGNYQEKAMELACLVADTLSLSSWKKIHNNISAVDKEVIRLLRRGYEKIGEKTAKELSFAILNEKETTHKKLEDIDDPIELLNYDLSETTLVSSSIQRMRELFVIPEVRERYLESFIKRQKGFEILTKGQEGNKQIEKKEMIIEIAKNKKYQLMARKYFKDVHITDIEKSTVDQHIIKFDGLITEKEQEKKDLLDDKATATTHRLSEIRNMKKQNGYIMTKSREEIFDEAIEKFFMGKHILLKGDTGSGKTAIAEEIVKKLEELTGEEIEIIKSKQLREESKDPELCKKIEIEVLSGNPQTGVGDLIGKQSLEGNISTKFQYGKLLRAFFDGRVCLIDEIDSIPGDILMRVKHLFELKAGRKYAPQENGHEWKTLLQTKIIATANIKSERYAEKENIPVPIQDLFSGGAIEVGYLDQNEIYDFILAELINSAGFIKGIGTKELSDAQNGIIPNLIACIKDIEDLFRKSGKGIEINNKQGIFLDSAMFTMRYLVPMFSKYPGGDLNAWIKMLIVDFIASANTPRDRLVLLKVFSKRGFVTKDDIQIYRHRGEIRTLSQVFNLSEEDLKNNIIAQKSGFVTSETPFLDPYEVANLDPFNTRKFNQKKSKNISELLKDKLLQINQTLIGSAEEKYENLITILENLQNNAEITLEDIQSIMAESYEIEDTKLIKEFESLGDLRKAQTEKIRLFDFQDPQGKRLFQNITTTSSPESREGGEIEQKLTDYLLTTQNERINKLKKTGKLTIEGGFELDTYLSDEEKRGLKILSSEDITETQRHERDYQGEKYTILTYKQRGQQYTAIQVPEKLKTMRYADTYMGKQLLEFKDEDRYPAFLTEKKLDSHIDQAWVIQKSSPTTDAEPNPHVNINVYNKGDAKGDIVREVAKKGGRMMDITDNIIQTELIKQKFGEAYLTSDFCGQNFNPASTDEAQVELQKKLKEIEVELQIQYEINKSGSAGYLNRDYSIYKRQVNRDGEEASYNGFLRGDFNSSDSALAGPCSVGLDGDLGVSRSDFGFRPCV